MMLDLVGAEVGFGSAFGAVDIFCDFGEFRGLVYNFRHRLFQVQVSGLRVCEGWTKQRGQDSLFYSNTPNKES
jgi:hypothetical protein